MARGKCPTGAAAAEEREIERKRERERIRVTGGTEKRARKGV
jgi:hypothetical protein